MCFVVQNGGRGRKKRKYKDFEQARSTLVNQDEIKGGEERRNEGWEGEKNEENDDRYMMETIIYILKYYIYNFFSDAHLLAVVVSLVVVVGH
eukprot:UN00639